MPGIARWPAYPAPSWRRDLSGHGIGPAAGHLVADIISGAEPIVDPRPYHPDRFAASAWGKVAEF